MPTDLRVMFDFGVGTNEMPCEREWDDDGWWCINDHTGCIFNDSHNTCNHRGDSLSPLDGADAYKGGDFIMSGMTDAN